MVWQSDVVCKQTPGKLLGFYWTEDRFWPDFANIKHYTQEFYRSYSSFISQCPRTSNLVRQSFLLDCMVWQGGVVSQSFLLDHMVWQSDVVCTTIILTWSHGLAGWCGKSDNHFYFITWFGRVMWYVRQSFLLDHMVWQGGVVSQTIILIWSHDLVGWCGIYDNHSYTITWFGRVVW